MKRSVAVSSETLLSTNVHISKLCIIVGLRWCHTQPSSAEDTSQSYYSLLLFFVLLPFKGVMNTIQFNNMPSGKIQGRFHSFLCYFLKKGVCILGICHVSLSWEIFYKFCYLEDYLVKMYYSMLGLINAWL